MDIIQTVLGFADSAPAIINAITMIIAGCAALAAVTPTTVDDNALAKLGPMWNGISKVINALALNVLRAKNQDDV
jgi:hypothetical protein